MTRRGWLLGAASGAILIGSLIGAGCKSSSSSNANATKTAQAEATPAGTTTSATSGDKAAFCRDNAAIDQGIIANGTLASAAGLLAYFEANQETIDDFGRTAPSDIRDDAQFLVDAVHAAISANDGTSLAGAEVQDAGARVDDYCGQNADGTEITPAP